MKNGYFQLIIGNGRTSVRMFPPVDGGEPFKLEELREYLARKGYNRYDQIVLNRVYVELKEPTDVPVDEKENYAEQETLGIQVSPDKMRAVARFYAPSNMGAVMDVNEIINNLRHQKIVAGIREKTIAAFVANRRYCTDYVIAEGIAPVQGSDARIEYFFNTNPNVKPKMNEDGTVNFFELEMISKCKQGDVLARLTRAETGEPGQNVYGERVPQRDVKKLILKFGRNIEQSEDGLEIRSQVNGHVSLVDDKVFVSDIYEVKDVDTSTGNIEYAGNVLIRGNVKAGFCVQAEGDIEVKGVVEGALLDAGGNIIIARGMNGMSKGMLTAKGNIISKFIENATVSSGGYIHTEAVLHSKVSAKGDIEVTGRKGFITGGVVRAGNMISAKMIGSSMGTDTLIEVGVDPAVKEKVNYLKKTVAEMQKSLGTIQPVLNAMSQKLAAGEKLPYEQAQYAAKLVETCKLQKTQLAESERELEELDGIMDTETAAQVRVSNEVYPGTKITISDVSLYVHDSYKHCRFIKSQGDVKMVGL